MQVDEIRYSTAMQLLAFLGLLDSFYLINIHSSPGICKPIESPFAIPLDCGTVARSEYSEVLGIPIAVFGVLFYISIIVFLSYYPKLNSFDMELSPYILGLGYLTGAFLFSLWLLYLQLAVIDAICIYYMGSLFSTSIIYILYLSNLSK